MQNGRTIHAESQGLKPAGTLALRHFVNGTGESKMQGQLWFDTCHGLLSDWNRTNGKEFT